VPSSFTPDLIFEPECRVIQISNLDPQTLPGDIEDAFGPYGDIDVIDVSRLQCGIASVKFFDLHAAVAARQSRINIRGKTLMVAFGQPDPVSNPRSPPNNGTIVVFHLRDGVSDDLIREEFSKFGEIRQIRSAPTRQTQRFVEFWDTRAAASALKAMKSRKFFDSKISVEYSLPGGFRKGQATGQLSRLPTIERVARLHPSLPIQ
jgi:RNA recognition motif-containing protein